MENGKIEETQPVKAEEKPVADAKSETEVKCENKDAGSAEEKSENGKGEEEAENVTDELLAKIKSQVEFYFGDVNMQRDKFLIEQTKLDEGWVPMSVMLKFKMLASLSTNVGTILKALEESELMEVSEDKKKIRRRLDKPLPAYDDAYRKAQAERTVYLKGFSQTETTMHGLKDFFKDMGEVENIVMRKYTDKDKKLCFKGSVFVMFKTVEDAKALLARESLKCGETELIKKTVDDWHKDKAKEREEKKNKRAKKTEGEAMEEEEEENDGFKLPTGAVLHFAGLPPNTEREALKAALDAAGYDDVVQKIVYIDHDKSRVDGHIRFDGEDSAKSILERLTAKPIKIEDNEVTFKLLEGEEEKNYLNEVKKSMSQKRQGFNKNKRGRGRKGGRGGYAGRGKKRSASPGSGAPPKKNSKTT